jgi:hypothetical protein
MIIREYINNDKVWRNVGNLSKKEVYDKIWGSETGKHWFGSLQTFYSKNIGVHIDIQHRK